MPKTRVLTTVLFTDIVGSTDVANDLGDRRWRELVKRHHAIVRRALKRYGGREIDTAGDGFFAVFDEPASAVRAAHEITADVQALGIDVRAGVHTGECEVMGKKLGGMAVHVGARILGASDAATTLVSGTTRDLVVGSGIAFEDRGTHSLKGVPGEWRLSAVREIDRSGAATPLDAATARERLALVEPTPSRRVGAGVAIGAAVAVAAIVGAIVLSGNGDEPEPSTSPTAAPFTEGLLAFDAATGAAEPGAEGTFGVSHFPGIESFAAGYGYLWTTDGLDALLRVDPETGQVEQVDIGQCPLDGIAAGFDAIWVVCPGSTAGGLKLVDPVTLTYEDVEAPGDVGATSGLAVDAGVLWITGGGQLVRVDQTDLSSELIEGVGADNVAAGGAGVFVTDELSNTITRVDGRTGEPMEDIEVPTGVDLVAVGDDALWVLNSSGVVTRVDPESGHTDDPIPIRGEATCITIAFDAVWVCVPEIGSIARIDPTTSRPEYFDVGAEVIDAVAESGSDRLWLLARQD